MAKNLAAQLGPRFLVQRTRLGKVVSTLPTLHATKDAAVRAAKRLRDLEGCSVRVVDASGNIEYDYEVTNHYLLDEES